MSKTQSIALTQSSALALATGMLVAGAPAQAQFNDGSFQADGVVVEGQAQIFRDPDITEVVVESEGVVIDWLPDDDFGSGDIDFQPFATTAIFRDDGVVTDFAVLNRILPSDVSRRVVFNGTVISEIQGQVGGTVFFYSPGGILVGNDAVFDVGNLGLTTADPLTDGNGNFITNNQVTFQQSNPTSTITIDPGASIFANQNQGSYVALFAPRIINRGGIFVDGQAALVGGEAGTITFSPDGLFDIQVSIGSEFSQPIENTGVIGGGASADGSNRVYMVAISKNNAATIAISGGSSLGFDVANSAFMDGDTVVLSAGFNISAGEIEQFEASNGFINISPEDSGFGPGATFTSSVIGQAASDVSINARDALDFQGNAAFSGRQALLDVNTNFGTGSVGSLNVGGDLTLLANHTRAGSDVGVAHLRLFNGTTANIAGNVRVGSIGTGDGNGDGRAQTSTGQVFVSDLGSTLNVGGDLIAQSSVDLADDFNNLIAQGGLAQVRAENNGAINVGGVTRVISDAIAGIGGSAEAGTAEMFTLTGGTITTGELNISADAVAGDSNGGGGLDATAGTARLNSSGLGSSIVVLNANTTGDQALGQLDFLSSEAFASAGDPGFLTQPSTGSGGTEKPGEAISGSGNSVSGGTATSGTIDLGVGPDAILSLPDAPGTPLFIINRAVGGDTLADFAQGGAANVGDTFFQVFGGVRNLGRISILTEAIGGSAASGTVQSSGGFTSGGTLNLLFNNTDTTIAIEQFRRVAQGGNASSGDGGFAGSGSTGTINVTATNSQVHITSPFDIISEAFGGTAAEVGGFASTGQVTGNFVDSTVLIDGDFTVTSNAVGGNSLNDQVFDPNFGYSEQGGGANSGNIFVFANTSEITVQNDIELVSSAFGGNAQVNQGGNAITGEVFIFAATSGALNTITANQINLRTLAEGGSIDPANTDSFGRGGDATTGRAVISFDGGDTLIDSSVAILTRGVGGDAGVLQGFGGNVLLGAATLGASVAGSATVTGDWLSEVQGVGGNSFAGSGGDVSAQVNEIFNHGGDVTIGGDATFATSAQGGDGQNGGNANGSIVRINTNQGSTTQIDGTLAFSMISTGGDGTFGRGGVANAGSLQLDAGPASSINIVQSLQFDASSTGGNSSANAGGDAFGTNVNLNAIGAGANISVQGANAQSSSFITTNSTGGGGSGGNGGFAQGGSVSLQAFNGGSFNLPNNLGAPFTISQTTTGGDTVEDDGSGGDASGSGITISLDNSTSNLGNLSLVSQTIGGSALSSAERTSGGDANTGGINFNISNSDVDVAFGTILLEGIGGNGSGDDTGSGGNAQFGNLNFTATNSTLDVASDLILEGIGRGGDGAAGGFAESPSANAFFSNSDVTIAGNLTLDLQAFGGMGTEIDQAGGSATTQFTNLDIENSLVDATGLVSLNSAAVGGDALDGDGGVATANRRDVNISGGSTLNALGLNFQGEARGGSALGQGSHSGGDALADHARLNYSFDGNTNIAAINADVSFLTTATGGDAAASGGAGGNATAGNGEIYNFGQNSVLSIAGNTNFSTTAGGGNSPQGLGGSANLGSAQVITFSGASVLIDGGMDVLAFGRGGDGQTGGDATGNSAQLLARGTITLGGAFSVGEQLFGGDALASDNPGNGGNAQGGSVQIASNNEASIPNSLVTIGSIDINSTVTGGSGGDGLNGADGGTGGNAFGPGGTILGRAINGILEVNGATTINTNVFGGRGGDGVNGGDGGQARFGGMQIGTSSGGSVPDTVGGSGTFTTIDIVRNNIGGDGGTASSGTGGDGGEAVGGSATLLSRGAPVNVGAVNFTFDATGGSGGTGATQGDGGDGVAGSGTLLATEAFENPGRGSSNIGSFTVNSTGQGGTGATSGNSEYSPFSDIEIEQSDVIIGSITVNIVGDNAPDYLVDDGMGNLTPVVFEPFFVSLRDGATLDFDSVTINTPGDVELFAGDGSSAFGNVFEINAGNFVPTTNDTSDPAYVPGVINAASSLVLTSSNGDIVADALLDSGNDLILNSAGSITARDLTAASVFLTLGAGGILDTGDVNAPGGLISIEAVDSLTAPATLDADSLLLRSLAGNVNLDSPIDIAGNFTADAGLSVIATDINAGSVDLIAGVGDITTDGQISASGLVNLASGGGISVVDVNAGSISATAQNGGFSAGSLIAAGEVNIEALDTITAANIDANAIVLRSINGFINSSGTLEADEEVEFDAGGSVNINSVTAQTLMGRAGIDLVVNGPIDAIGVVNLEAMGGGLVVGDVNGGGITLRSLDNNVVVQGGLTTMGFATIEAAGGIFLDSVFAGALVALAQGGDITTQGAIFTDGSTNLDASGSVTINDVNAGSIQIGANGGSIGAGNLNAANGNADLIAANSINVANVDALNITMRAEAGDIDAAGALTAQQDIDIEASDDVTIQMASARTLGLRSLFSSVSSSGPIAVENGANIAANNDVSLADVTAGSITTQAGGTTNISGLWQAPLVTVTTPMLDIGVDGSVDAGSTGEIAINSTNGSGVLVGDSDDLSFAGLALDMALLEHFTAGNFEVTATGTAGQASLDGAVIRVGNLDVTATAGLNDVTFVAGEEIAIEGSIVSAGDLGLEAGLVTLDTQAGRIDLGTDGSTLDIDANAFIAGDAGVIDGFNDGLSVEDAQALINTPAAAPIEGGVITAGSIVLDVRDAAVIQNVGSDEEPAGFVIGNAEGLTLQGANRNGATETGALIILNGQVADASGTNLTGDAAATEIFANLGEEVAVATGSQINACDFVSCDDVPAVAEDNGEVTSTVSASVNGATANAGSTSGGSDAGTTGSTGDAGSDSSGESAGSDSSDEGSSEEGDSSGTTNTAATAGTTTAAGETVNVDNVDDGGGGPGEFDIDTGDSSGDSSGSGSSDAAGSESGSDAGSETGSDGDAGSDADSGGEDSASESGSDEGEGSSDDGEGSDDSDSSEESENSEEGEESEESEDESEEESEEEEEESSEEEEEESEGPATGPISAPPSIINTNALEQRGTINDPISGSGNPALLDPDVAPAPPPAPTNSQEGQS